MYKTVRHGENSLQYKILAQQEDGLPGVKRRKSPKAVIVKLVAIIMLLVVGIVASAFLVPLLLANDFIAVTGTFQKFSVSTLRRSHSGNHVVVIAKKPYGWNAPHPTIPPRLSNASQSLLNDPEKSPPATEPPHTANDSSGTTLKTARTTAMPRTTAQTTATISTTSQTTPTTRATAETTATESLPVQFQRHKLTTNPEPEKTTGSSEGNRAWVKFPPTNAIIRQQQSFQKETKVGEVVSSELAPVWYKANKKWQFDSSNKSDEEFNHFLNLVAGFVIVAVLMCFIAIKFMCRRKALPEKETEDKRKLLKTSASSDHDEE